MASTSTFNFDLVRAFGIHSPGSTSTSTPPPATSTSTSTPPLFTSKPLHHPAHRTFPTKYTLPISPPAPHRKAPTPHPHLPTRKHTHHRSNHLLSPLHEPERKGLWTVSEDHAGERAAEWEDADDEVVQSRPVGWMSSERGEAEVDGLNGFVDIDLFDRKLSSCSASSCTSEEPSQCVTPSLESDSLEEDVFFGSPSDLQRDMRGKRTSTCSFENGMSEEEDDEAGLFFAPTMMGVMRGRRLDGVNLKRDGFARELRTFEDCPSSPSSSEESFGCRLSPSRTLFNPSNTLTDNSRRPPPLDLQNNLAWRSSLETTLPTLGSPFTPSPAPNHPISCGLMSPIDLDPTTPKNAILFSMTTPPPLSRSSRSSSVSSTTTTSSSSDQPITPSPRPSGGKTEDLLSATFVDFLMSAEEDPVSYIGVASPMVVSKRGEINFPLPPFRLGSDLPSTPPSQSRTNALGPPGAPARARQPTTLPPPSSSALHRAMGLKTGHTLPLGRGSGPDPRDRSTIKPRHAIPTSGNALQRATGLASTADRSPTKPCSVSSTCSSPSSSSSTKSRSRSALPTRSPLPKDWIGYHPKENRI